MPNKILIFIDKKLKKDISRYFVLSHELGHAILHQNCNNRCDRKNMDKEADFFATSLLMKYTNIQVTT
jgi:Predicted Zn peptidase